MENHTFQLLERVAEGLARELLLSVPRLEGIKLEIKKPWAPVGLPLETVSVEIERWKHRAYIALGSNMGDKGGYLRQAVESLNQTEGCRVEQVSDFIVTSPYGGVEQDDFLNGVLKMETILTPLERWIVSMRSKKRQTGSGSSAGVPGRWIWISCCTMIWFWIPVNFISRISICTGGFRAAAAESDCFPMYAIRC